MVNYNIRRIKIAYYSLNDPLDKRSWSGITYYLGQALNNNLGEVEFLGPVKFPWLLEKSMRGIQKIIRFVSNTEWISKYSFIKNIYAAYILNKRCSEKRFDFLFAPAAAPELAFVKTSLPIIYFGDTTFKSYSKMYKKEFKNLNKISKWEGNKLEMKALKKSHLIIFSSNWALQSAIDDYGISPEKLAVIQMGANIENVPSLNGIHKKEKNEILTLLFLSVDWERKGGSIAFQAFKILKQKGLKVKLIVCGCNPDSDSIDESLEVIPFLNKNLPKDLQKFEELMFSVNFLLLPTRADCTPMVNSEANAYGVPVITTDVGGVSEAIKNGINGYCLPLEANAQEYANLILEIFSDEKRYHQLISSSRKIFDQELNWQKFSENLEILLKKHLII